MHKHTWTNDQYQLGALWNRCYTGINAANRVIYLVESGSLPIDKNIEGFWVINRKWSNNDKMDLTIPMSLHSECMPDNPNREAFLYGPIVLAAPLGKDTPDPVFGTPVMLTDSRNIKDFIKPLNTDLEPLKLKVLENLLILN